MKHVKWPSIESFAHIRKSVEIYGETVGETSYAHRETLTYRGKIKLHGTNAGVTLQAGGVYAQSRTAILTPEKDNMGFAAWVEARKADFQKLAETYPDETVTVFGEFCGPGIQKGAAVCNIPEKMFAVFALQVDEQVVVEPEALQTLLGQIENVKVLPWADVDTVRVNWTDVTQMQTAVDYINARIEEIDHVDPYIKAEFGVEGHGEGLVWYPVSVGDAQLDRNLMSAYMFKTKGEKHKVVKTRKAATVDPAVLESINEFVAEFVTENRLEQIATEALDGNFDLANIGAFLGRFAQDVKKESGPEREASGLEWKQIQKAVTAAARTWYLNAGAASRG